MGNFKRTMVTLLACFTVLCLSIGFFPWATLTKTASADAATQAGFSDVNNNGSIDYVAFGDSMTNGYGRPGYYLALQKHENEGHEYDPADGLCHLPDGTTTTKCSYVDFGGPYTYTEYLHSGNSFGYLANDKESYPSLIADALEDEYNKDVNLLNMAISGMRIEELRMLLDKGYAGDGYTRRYYVEDTTAFAGEPRFKWSYDNAYRRGYSYIHENILPLEVVDDNDHAEVYSMYTDFKDGLEYKYYDAEGNLTGQASEKGGLDGTAKVAAQYQYAIKNADLISIALGTNNFGTGSQPAIYRTLQQLFGVTLGDTTDYLYDLDALLSEYPTMVGYAKEIQTKLHGIVLTALGQEMYNKYMPAVQDIVDTYTYGLIGFISNYKVVLDKIHVLNPDAKIVLVGAMNMEAGLVFDFNGITVNFGELYGSIIEAANLWLNNYACTLNEKRDNENIVYSQTETVELIIDEIGQGKWNQYVLSYMTRDFEQNLGNERMLGYVPNLANSDGVAILGLRYFLAATLNAIGMNYENASADNNENIAKIMASCQKVVTKFWPNNTPCNLTQNDYIKLSHFLLNFYDTAMQLIDAMENSALDHHVDITAVARLFGPDSNIADLLSDPSKYYLNDTQDFLYFYARMMFASGAGVHPSANGHRVVADEIVDTLKKNVTAQERLEEKIEIIKTTYVTAVREAIANTFSSEVVGTIDAIGKWFNNNGYDKKVIEYAFKLQAAIDNNTPNVAKQVIGEALAEIQSIKAEAIAPESYTVNEDSYYVSIGDSQITGHGLTGYDNYGYDTYVEGAAPYELAKALYGEEAQSRYKQLCMGGLRADDLRWILDPSFAADAYSTNYVLGNLSSYAGATTVEQAREIFVSELQKADLISLSIGGGNITTYVGQQIYNVLSTGNRPLYTNDWSRYLTAEGEAKVLGIIEKVAGLAIQKLGISVDGGYATFMGKRVHVETLIKVTVESVIYGYFGFSVNLPKVVELIQEINPTAKLLVLGYFNPVDEMTVTLGKGEGAIVLPVGQFISQFVKLTNTQTSLLSLMNDSVTYVDVKDASCFFDKTVQEGGSVTIMDYMGAVFQNSELTHADLDGHAYIKKQMRAGLTVTCAHVFSNDCQDTICNACGHEAREAVDHKWANNCAVKCDNCDATRIPPHVYSSDCDTHCNGEDCNEKRVVSAAHTYTDCEDEICNECSEIRVKPGHRYTEPCGEHCLDCETGVREPSVPHTYDDNCDAICNVCGETRIPPHTFANDCQATDCSECGVQNLRDAVEHVYAHDCSENCSNCTAGTRTDVEHSFDNDCQDTDCNVCGEANAREAFEHDWTNACDADCNVCDVTRTPPHVYSADCDTSCNQCGELRVVLVGHEFNDDCYDQSCNVCGEIARAYAEHVYAHACSENCENCTAGTRVDVEHTFANDCQATDCNVCGKQNAREAVEHVYVSDCDTGCENCAVTRTADPHTFDDDCHDQTCNLCGETARAFAEHVFDAVCDNTCNNCAHTREQAPHTFDNDCQDVICNVCGKEARQAAEHVYTAVCDVTCENCDVVRVAEPHTYTHDCSTICSACGDVREASVAHTYDFDCDAQCNVCGEERSAKHVYDHNCDVDCNLCGDVRTPYEHVYDGPKDEKCNVCGFVREREVLPGFDFGCAGYVDGVIAVISLAGIALVKVIADKKRK